MLPGSRKKKATREPDTVWQVNLCGVALWTQPSGDHDIRVGLAYPGKNGGKGVVGSTYPIGMLDEKLLAEAQAYVSLSQSDSVPQQMREYLALFGELIPLLVEDVRSRFTSNQPPAVAVPAMAGNGIVESNGISGIA